MRKLFLQNGNAMAILAVVVTIVVVGIGVWYALSSNTKQDATNTDEVISLNNDLMMGDDTMQEEVMNDDSMMVSEVIQDDNIIKDDSIMSDVVEVTLDGFNFGYSQDEIRVHEGDIVKIVLTSTDGFHDWVVDEFSAATSKINTDETTSVEFIADKKGTFEFYCSVGQHRAMGMKGRLIVEQVGSIDAIAKWHGGDIDILLKHLP